MQFPISTIDLAIIILYFLVVLAIGLAIGRKTKSGSDLFLAGRSLSWWAIGFSLFASNISSTTLIGLSGTAYAAGISVANYEWMASIVLVFFVIFFIPFYLNSRISTVPEFLEKRFDRRSRVYFSALTIFTSIVVDTAGSLYAGAIVLQIFFPGADLFATCAGLAIVAGIYTAAGGLAAVVYTDVIQGVVLLVGSCVITYMLFAEIDFSWAAVTATTPPEMLSLIRPIDDPHLPWLGTLIGVPILGFYFWCTNQFIVQRVLGAKDVEHARWGSLLGGLLKLPVLFIMVLPGTMARVAFPDLANGDLVFPTMITELLPIGLKGLVLAGLIAAIMSSVDSTLNSASALVTLDFIKAKRPDMTPEQTAKVGRFTIILFMLFASLWAPQIANFQGLFAYLQQALAYIVPPVVAVFILGVFWRRTSPTAALVTLVGGHIVSAGLFYGATSGAIELHFTIIAGLLFAISSVICVVTSNFTAPAPDAVLSQLTWGGASAEAKAAPERPWYLDYRHQSAVLLFLTAVLVIAYW